jgi:hypothetical protein
MYAKALKELGITFTCEHKNNGQCSFYDTNFNLLPFKRSEYQPIKDHLIKPKSFDLMLLYAEVLSKDFPHVRVDFYLQNEIVVLGELTFYPASGYTKFSPDIYDYQIGKKFNINSIVKKINL